MKDVLLLTLGQVGALFVFIAIGYILNKTKIIKDARPLSSALMWVFLPAVVFNVFYKNFTLTNFSKALPFLIAGVVVLALTLAVAYPFVKKYKDRISRNTMWYSLAITNMAYMGITLIANVFPNLYLFFMVFTIGFHIFILTVGVMMFAPEGKKVTLKGLLSPIIIALFVGMACGLIFDAVDTKLPVFLEGIIDSAAACMSPVAMLVTGFSLARLPLSKVFNRWDVYLVCAMRLIVIPAVLGGIGYLLHLWLGLSIDVVKVVIIYSALPMGLNTVVFVEANGGDGTLGAQCAFISHLMCIVTMPIAFGIVALL